MKPYSIIRAVIVLGVFARSVLFADESSDKVKIKGDRVVVKDKSKPVRRALEECYARLKEATERNDADAMLTPSNR